MKFIPSTIVPIIKEGESLNCNLFDILKNKKVVIFGVPGAFYTNLFGKTFAWLY